MTISQLAAQIISDIIAREGVSATASEEAADAMALRALRMAWIISTGQIPTTWPPEFDEEFMALPDYFKTEPGTAKTIKASGGTAAITLASLANGSYRQAATLDLGANWARWWRIDTDFELAATPTAGNAINLFGSFNNSTGAGKANTSGSDAAYTGYSSNAAASVKQLEFLGAHICTAQATATVQKAMVGLMFPKGRYLNLVVDNESGAAFHSSDTNQVITLTPLEELIQDTV